MIEKITTYSEKETIEIAQNIESEKLREQPLELTSKFKHMRKSKKAKKAAEAK